jgi:serpin B
MLVLLPKKIEGLADLEESLTADNLKKWGNRLRNKEVDVCLPKFKLTSQFYLGERLQSMGMTNAFTPNKADFSGMDGKSNWPYLKNVIHKAFVDVNEEGTEAAASTAIMVTAICGDPRRVVFRADHPFFFMIKEKTTGSILFIGRIVDPARS